MSDIKFEDLQRMQMKGNLFMYRMTKKDLDHCTSQGFVNSNNGRPEVLHYPIWLKDSGRVEAVYRDHCVECGKVVDK